MRNSVDYFQYHKELIKTLYQHCCRQLPFSSEKANEVDLEFLNALKQLSNTEHLTDDYSFQGQAIISKIISHYPHITPAVHRDLMWYFGGECLHYLSDEEISQYQQVDELFNQAQHQGDKLGYTAARAQVFKLH